MKALTRIEAAKELLSLYNSYEVRKVVLKTIYNRIFKDGDNWRLIGYAHDYTAFPSQLNKTN